MSMPKQAPPVRRPEIVEPHRLVEVERGTPQQLLRARLLLLHGANYNDPAAWEAPSYARMRASALQREPHAAPGAPATAGQVAIGGWAGGA